MFTPVSTDSFLRTSASTSACVRSFSSNGASISDTFTPKACSSSSARPVLRATVFISGTVSSSFSARRPMLSDSSSEMPGRVLTLIVNDPSLKGGKKLRPKVKNNPRERAKRMKVTPKTYLRCEMAASKATR